MCPRLFTSSLVVFAISSRVQLVSTFPLDAHSAISFTGPMLLTVISGIIFVRTIAILFYTGARGITRGFSTGLAGVSRDPATFQVWSVGLRVAAGAGCVGSHGVLIVNDDGASVAIVARELPLPNRAILKKYFEVKTKNGNTGRTITTGHLKKSISFVYGINGSVFKGGTIRRCEHRGLSVSGIVEYRAPSNITLVAISKGTRGSVIISYKTGSKVATRSVRTITSRVHSTKVLLLRLRVPIPTILHTTRVTRSTKICMILGPTPTTRLPRSVCTGVSSLVPGRARVRLLANYAPRRRANLGTTIRALFSENIGGVVLAEKTGKSAFVRGNS